MVTRQLQVERRTAKERWPETDVLPLTHADQHYDQLVYSRKKKKETLIESFELYTPYLTYLHIRHYLKRRTASVAASTRKNKYKYEYKYLSHEYKYKYSKFKMNRDPGTTFNTHTAKPTRR